MLPTLLGRETLAIKLAEFLLHIGRHAYTLYGADLCKRRAAEHERPGMLLPLLRSLEALLHFKIIPRHLFECMLGVPERAAGLIIAGSIEKSWMENSLAAPLGPIAKRSKRRSGSVGRVKERAAESPEANLTSDELRAIVAARACASGRHAPLRHAVVRRPKRSRAQKP